MDYLRSLGSAAASSLIQKSGLTLPFSLGDRVIAYGDPIWTLYDATKRARNSVPHDTHDASDPQRRDLLPLAKNALRKLRTTRHPDILKFIDVMETDSSIHIVTERVQPLWAALERWSSKPVKSREEWLTWGLHRISVALAFINDACQSSHGMVRVESIFISPSGEWRLGGLDVMSNPTDSAAVLYPMGERSRAYKCPEVHKGGWSALKEIAVSAIDGYSLGILIHTVFNIKDSSHDPLPATANPPHTAPGPSAKGAIPNAIFPHYKKLLNPTPAARLTPSAFLNLGTAPGSFFSENPLFRICEALEGFALSNEAEKSSLLRTIKDSTASFPPEFTQHKILPTLLTSLGHGGTSANAILPVVLALGKDLPPTEYTATIVGPVVNLFATPDRGTRMALLEGLPEFADKLDKNTVVNKVWPHLQTGFGDTVAVIREATVRSIILISSKLSDRILNNDLLRHLAKAQLDPEPSMIEPETAPEDPQSIIGAFPLGGASGSTSVAGGSSAALVTSAAGAAGALAGWAISSLGRKLATSEAQGSLSNAPSTDRPASAPPESLGIPAVSAPPSPAASIATVPSHSKGMQLGTNTNTKQLLSEDDEWGVDSGAADVANAWGGNLMDVNADTDDWGAFEAAAPETVAPKPVSVIPARAKTAPTQARTSTLSPPQVKPRTSSPLACPSVKNVDTWGSFEQEAPAATAEKAELAKSMSLAGLSKEEKAAEMARRREERKQKIAQMKAQKQG
ncbi:hypothetical protein RSAG8_09378, partial [Rhizoctonia solani AG-8 WAC10335]